MHGRPKMNDECVYYQQYSGIYGKPNGLQITKYQHLNRKYYLATILVAQSTKYFANTIWQQGFFVIARLPGNDPFCSSNFGR